MSPATLLLVNHWSCVSLHAQQKADRGCGHTLSSGTKQASHATPTTPQAASTKFYKWGG